MKRVFVTVAALLCSVPLAVNAMADSSESVGGDLYVSGASPTASVSAPRDIFVFGFAAELSGDVAKDAHISGFDVEVNGKVGGNLYAAGSSVSIDGDVGEDLSASGFSIRLKDGTTIGGNARLAAGTMRIGGNISGSLVAAGGNIELDGLVAGDVRLTGANIAFGEDARINGALVYSAPEKIDIPASVIAPERVRFEPLSRAKAFDEWSDKYERGWPSFPSILFGFILTVGFLFVVGAIFIAVIPQKIDHLRTRALSSPWLSLLAGVLGLAMMIGLVPVSAMTVIGLPLIPVLITAIIVIWTLAYLLGTYTVSAWIYRAFRSEPETTGARLLALGVGLVVLALVNFIPVVGWLINVAIVLFGIGAFILSVVLPIGRMSSTAGQTPKVADVQENNGE